MRGGAGQRPTPFLLGLPIGLLVAGAMMMLATTLADEHSHQDKIPLLFDAYNATHRFHVSANRAEAIAHELETLTIKKCMVPWKSLQQS